MDLANITIDLALAGLASFPFRVCSVVPRHMLAILAARRHGSTKNRWITFAMALFVWL
jgi:hypothetical protein